MDYGDLSYLLEAEYERQLVGLSQDAELMSLPIGTRSLSQGKVSLLPACQSLPYNACHIPLSLVYPQSHVASSVLLCGTRLLAP